MSCIENEYLASDIYLIVTTSNDPGNDIQAIMGPRRCSIIIRTVSMLKSTILDCHDHGRKNFFPYIREGYFWLKIRMFNNFIDLRSIKTDRIIFIIFFIAARSVLDKVAFWIAIVSLGMIFHPYVQAGEKRCLSRFTMSQFVCWFPPKVFLMESINVSPNVAVVLRWIFVTNVTFVLRSLTSWLEFSFKFATKFSNLFASEF